MVRVSRSGAPAALGLAALLLLSAATLALGGVGVEVRCDAARCRVASGSILDAPVRFTFTRAEVESLRDLGGTYRGRPGSRISCSLPTLVGHDASQRPLYPREVCPVHAALDPVELRQWLAGTRESLHATDWIVGVNVGTLLGILLCFAWVLGHLLGREEITADRERGVTVRRGGFAARLNRSFAPPELQSTLGIKLHGGQAQGIASADPLPSGHLYVETRDGRWNLLTRRREDGLRLLAALGAWGLPHRVDGDGLLTRRAGGSLGRLLLGSALWSATLLAGVALTAYLLFDQVVPSLP